MKQKRTILCLHIVFLFQEDCSEIYSWISSSFLSPCEEYSISLCVKRINSVSDSFEMHVIEKMLLVF